MGKPILHNYTDSTLIPEDDSVRLLSHLLEGLNYNKLLKAYSHKGRKPAVHPKTLFKIIAYAYMNNIYQSREIEKACKRDINFMWLLNGQKAPDHTTISRFRKRLGNGIAEDLFYQLVQKLKSLDEIQFENLFVDGTKIEANANRYTFVWRKAVEKNAEKLLVKVQALVEKINQTYGTNFAVSCETVLNDMANVRGFLEKKRVDEKIEFVQGSGKRKTELQKFSEELQNYYKRQEVYDRSNELFGDRSSFSKTDPDATFMRMKEDHMKNGQLKPAYNVQIAVEAEYVVGVGIFQDRNDVNTLIPMLENMKCNLDAKYRNIVADSGYESEENYAYLESEGMTSYIKPQSFDQMRKRSFAKNIGKRENMTYVPETDEYICHNQRRLRPVKTKYRRYKSGYQSEITIYECENCSDCPFKPQCTRAAGNRTIQVSKRFLEQRQRSLENISTIKGLHLRVNRSIQAEGAFGVLKSDYRFNRFLTRGKNNVETELLLLCFGYNINKLHAKIQNKRLRTGLHELRQTA
jgi:transposase/RNase P subunit RPR2